MKRLLSISILVLVFAQANSQCGPPQKVNSNYQFKAAGADTVQRLPNGLPSLTCWLSAGDIFYAGPDSNVYIWTGTEALPVDRPAPPLQGVQWNHNGHFGADTTFIFDTAFKTVFENNVVQGNPSPGQYGRTLLTQRLPDSSWVTLQHYPTLQIFGDFYRGLDQTFINVDGQRDATLFDCYNCDAPGSPVATGEIEMDRSIESHFVGTGMEMYDQFVYPPSLGSFRVRPVSYNQPFGSVRSNNLLYHFDQYNFFDEPGTLLNYSFRSDGHFICRGVFPETTWSLIDSATGAGLEIATDPNPAVGNIIFSSTTAGASPTTINFGATVTGAFNEAVWSTLDGTVNPYNLSMDTTNYLVDPVSLTASLTLILSGTARDGQIVDVYFGGHIPPGTTVVTAFTLAANSGAGQTLFASPTLAGISVVSGQHIRVKYQALNSRWYNSN